MIMCGREPKPEHRPLRCVVCTNRVSPVLTALLSSEGVETVAVMYPVEPREQVAQLLTALPDGVSRIPYRKGDDAETLRAIRVLEPDVLLTYSFQHILPAPYFSFCVGINLHPSLLPAYPGLNPWMEQWRDGVHTGGFTVHRLAEQVDSGAVLGQVAFPWPSKTERADLNAFIDFSLRQYGAPLLMEVLTSLSVL